MAALTYKTDAELRIIVLRKLEPFKGKNMKSRLSKTLVSGLLLVAPLQLFADDAASTVSTKAADEDSSPIHKFLPTSYGKAELRQYESHKKDKNHKYEPSFQPMFTLGAKFFDDSLKSELIFAAKNKYSSENNSGLFGDKGTRLENELTVYKHDYFSLVPFAYIEFPKISEEGKGTTKVELGLDIPVSIPVETTAGVFSMEAELIGKTYLSSRPDPEDLTEVRGANDLIINKNDAGYALTDEKRKKMGLVADEKTGNLKTDPNGRTWYHSVAFGAGYKPSFVPGLSTKALAIYETTLTPSMTINKETDKVENRTRANGLPVYSQKFEPSYLLHVKYAFTPVYSLTNEFTYYGVEDSKQKYSNMLSFVAKVF